MHDRHQVLDYLALGREPFIVEHQDLASVPGREALEPWISEAGEPVPVRDDEVADLAPFDPVHEVEELRSLEVEATADLLDPDHVGEPSRRTEVAEDAHLVLQIGFLSGARHPAVSEGSCVRCLLLGTDAEEGVDVGLGVPSPPRRRPSRRRQTAHTVAAVPLMSTSAACGFPSPADDHMDRPLDFNGLLVKNPAATVAVRISGESMRDQGLYPGDIAVVDRARSAISGSIVLGLVGGEFTIKTYRLKAGGAVMPEAADPDFPDIVITEASAFEVCGVVTGTIRTF